MFACPLDILNTMGVTLRVYAEIGIEPSLIDNQMYANVLPSPIRGSLSS